jgi:hypothetical protein
VVGSPERPEGLRRACHARNEQVLG